MAARGFISSTSSHPLLSTEAMEAQESKNDPGSECRSSFASLETVETDAHNRVRHPKLIVKIVSASYGPCEGRRLLTGELSTDEAVRIPYTRDVTPFLRALLIAQQQKEAQLDQSDQVEEPPKSNSTAVKEDEASEPRIIEMNALTAGMNRARIGLLSEMRSMNAVFGDPCPGTSKRLHVHYLVREVDEVADRTTRAASSEVHHMSFAEHERVALRRRATFFQEDSILKRAATRASAKKKARILQDEASTSFSTDVDEGESTLIAARRIGRSRSIEGFTQDSIGAASETKSVSLQRKRRLSSASFEIVLPIVMPYLEVRERVQCRLVCRLWRHIVRDFGVAVTIDNNDPTFPRFTRPFLRGILAHSFSSLQSLFLSGSEDLEQSDFHPSIPHLRKLRSLDISWCIQLDDITLRLLSQHVSETLEVLYIKGLRRVTDDGVISISRSCSKLKVIEVSNVPITDQAGIAIGENLTELRAIYMRDNYQLTNQSIDVITEKCTQLEQLTLWGCIHLHHLSFDPREKAGVVSSGNLILLNLWGCHSLRDDSATALVGMKNLRSLIVSECHRLTDAFVIALGQNVPQLSHLNLRYCKRLTDTGVNAIAQQMRDLYALDLSFCTKVTVASLFNLLEIRGRTLAELRIQNCRKLDIALNPNGPGDGGDGRMILSALRSLGQECCVSILDLRQCGGQPGQNGDPFVEGMILLNFEQKLPGYFERKARWNTEVERNLVEQCLASVSDYHDRLEEREA